MDQRMENKRGFVICFIVLLLSFEESKKKLLFFTNVYDLCIRCDQIEGYLT